ncbi:methyltransferase [Simiduia agarivorans]|uniref:SAM-dependent methyltransferase n=1 Tax=Simiduia agarivorans (strain DSM 21679 / JCM 13881 / BCRC 17597 / SA1) TaxID=1117647 RepID=K4KKK9_SIMAS|nr:methyltransferase [Simiduia agarivorans]AFU98583.1 SAM-dependent methyltransferase [Simiduia agarivorans SA1 = DSM 21679]
MTDNRPVYFTDDKLTALDARYEAQKLAFGPLAFQAARCLRKFGLLEIVSGAGRRGVTLEQLQAQANISDYGVRVLMEASLGIGLCTLNDGSYRLTKTGLFVLTDPMTIANFDFNHDINYQGFFHLDEAIEKGEPAGLKALGDWSTIYEGLSSLTEQQLKSWLAFDHYYSDGSFGLVMDKVFAKPVTRLMDIGGNTGKWARACVSHDDKVQVTLVDLPQQVALATQAIKDHAGAARVSFYPTNILNPELGLPKGHDVVWMSQFLDCFSDAEITGILNKVAAVSDEDTRIFIMETFWDRQKFEAGAFCLQQTSLYFTCLANGNSQMYHSDVFRRCVEAAGMEIVATTDDIGVSHTLLECRLVN